jgi:tetratricopeptide (TPR) repeat protein
MFRIFPQKTKLTLLFCLFFVFWSLSLQTLSAQKIFRTTVTEDYIAAKVLLDKNLVREARDAWNSILVDRGYELSGAQKTALAGCVKKCDAILKERIEATITNMDRADVEIAKAKPLLKAILPLYVKEKEEHLNEALTYLQKCTDQEKETNRYSATSAFCYLNLDVPDIAKPFIDKALEIDENDFFSLNLLARYYYISDNLDDALSTARKSLDIESKDNDTGWYWMVRTLFEKGDNESQKRGWKYIKKAIGNDVTIAKEFEALAPTPKHKTWLQDYGRELANVIAKKEKEALLEGGPSVRRVQKGAKKN